MGQWLSDADAARPSAGGLGAILGTVILGFFHATWRRSASNAVHGGDGCGAGNRAVVVAGESLGAGIVLWSAAGFALQHLRALPRRPLSHNWRRIKSASPII